MHGDARVLAGGLRIVAGVSMERREAQPRWSRGEVEPKRASAPFTGSLVKFAGGIVGRHKRIAKGNGSVVEEYS
jgi:hypothetical protein